ncbi:MAG: ATP-dependent Clp protease ATP-binding subunit ClpX, partial [Bacteriovoracaceae bacterium]|nr:ATP-dependent Clp protease ATP-binding subunit ClpX [Bacteriovoracaceae bacterium]
IPEFIGRLPVNALLQELDEEALMRILTEPKNAITKQYIKLFEMDGITLSFENDALVEVAKTALKKKTGARGLRAILEQSMLDVMYELPSNEKIVKCIVTKDSILGKSKPELIEGEREKKANKASFKEAKGEIENAS